MKGSSPFRSHVVAIAICLAVASVAIQMTYLPFAPFTVGEPAEHPVDALFLAVLLGVVLRNAVPMTAQWDGEIASVSKRLLPLAIALMGARLQLTELLETSGISLILSIVCVAFGLCVTLWIGKKMNLSGTFSLLLGAGTAICGGTAIAALAPVVHAKREETALSITTVTGLGTIAIVLLPALGVMLEMTQEQFGLWAGLAVHATPQVIATGFAFGERAGELALVVKLVRILLLIPLIVLARLWLGRRGERKLSVKKLFPGFLWGFLALVLCNSLGYLDAPMGSMFGVPSTWSWRVFASRGSSFLFAVAMVGVGHGVGWVKVRDAGSRPFLVGVAAFAAVATVSALAVLAWI